MIKTKLTAGLDEKTGCAVLFDEHGDIKAIIPNGKMTVQRLGDECEECRANDLAFARRIAAALNAATPVARARSFVQKDEKLPKGGFAFPSEYSSLRKEVLGL